MDAPGFQGRAARAPSFDRDAFSKLTNKSQGKKEKNASQTVRPYTAAAFRSAGRRLISSPPPSFAWTPPRFFSPITLPLS